jgi:carbonic anhydrase
MSIERLFENNATWAAKTVHENPRFFERLQQQQSPEYLWIGCSDSRVPANEIVGLAPGELFVHRNVANVVVHTDLNCLSVLQYAVDVLKVKHVIVTGHYGCGGVRAAFDGLTLGLIDNWLRHVQDVQQRHAGSLAKLAGEAACDRLCELNVIEQARHVCETTVVRDAWSRGVALDVHGWIYGLSDGRLRDLKFCVSGTEGLASAYERAIGSSRPN